MNYVIRPRGTLHVEFFQGLQLNRLQMLMALSLVFLALVVLNGLFKFYINTYKGRLGERMTRRRRANSATTLIAKATKNG